MGFGTSLTIDNARITAQEGYKVEMTLNSIKKEIETGGTYTGNIVLSLRKILE